MTQGWVDRVIFQAGSAGTGDFAVAAAVQGYNTPAQSLAVDGTLYHYSAQILDSGGNIIEWEVGTGAYTAGTTTLARTTVEFSSNGTSKVSFSAAPQVMITALAADFSATPVVPAIEPESGSSPIKISAFPDAATNMASADRITGLQGGANTNFSQANILTGVAGTSGSHAGNDLSVTAGTGFYDGTGGTLRLYGGYGGLPYGSGGVVFVRGGNAYGVSGSGGDVNILPGDTKFPGAGSGNGGSLHCYGGIGAGNAFNGGNLIFHGGDAYNNAVAGNVTFYGGESHTGNQGGGINFVGGTSTGYSGGLLYFRGGTGANGYKGGSIYFKMGPAPVGGTSGLLYFVNLRTVDPSATHAIWANNGVLVQSGIGNFSGTITTGSLVGKTITVVNGIITSFV